MNQNGRVILNSDGVEEGDGDVGADQHYGGRKARIEARFDELTDSLEEEKKKVKEEYVSQVSKMLKLTKVIEFLQAVQVQPAEIQWPKLTLPRSVEEAVEGERDEDVNVSIKVRLTHHTSQPNIEDIGLGKRGAKVKAEQRIMKTKM